MPYEEVDGIPEKGILDIVYEDEEVLIVNKPSYCVTHPSKNHAIDTLANYVSHYWKTTGVNAKIRFINRLDRDTTGLVAIAKNKYVHHYVQKQMTEGLVSKKYHAFVTGKLKCLSGSITEPIGQPYEDSIHRVVTDKGKPCVTHYQVVEEYEKASLVELTLETGRTHQIRVHLQYLGNPILGDPLYSESDLESYGMEHQALHAKALSFSLPRKNNLTFEADYSKELKDLRNQLGNYEKKKVIK